MVDRAAHKVATLSQRLQAAVDEAHEDGVSPNAIAQELERFALRAQHDFRHVIAATERVSQICKEDFLSGSRFRDLAHVRQAAMFVLRTDHRWSTPKVAMAFGKTDHTTVLHACNMVRSRMDRGDQDATFMVSNIRDISARLAAATTRRVLRAARA